MMYVYRVYSALRIHTALLVLFLPGGRWSVWFTQNQAQEQEWWHSDASELAGSWPSNDSDSALYAVVSLNTLLIWITS